MRFIGVISSSFSERFKTSGWLTQFFKLGGQSRRVKIAVTLTQALLNHHKDAGNKQLREPPFRVLLVCLREQLLLVNSVSFLVTEGIDPYRALSAYLLPCWSGSFGSTRVTDTSCLLKGLRLAVTLDVSVILYYSWKHLVPWCQADCPLCVIIVAWRSALGLLEFPDPFYLQSKIWIKHKVSVYTSPVRALANRKATQYAVQNLEM